MARWLIGRQYTSKSGIYLKTNKSIVWLLLAPLVGLNPQVEPPQVELTNGLVRAVVYLPDAQHGYYQGTRFDWAGAFKCLDYNGHRYIDEWFETYNPKTHDAINGPAEEFAALGYAQARPGGTFLKIGVGVLRKPDEKDYSFARYYDVVNGGNWTVKRHKTRRLTDAVEFRHDLTDSTGSYSYTKTVRLGRGKPELVLEHQMTNTGRKPIETIVYNHNFWVIDKQPVGPQLTIRFPFAVTGAGLGFGSIVQTRDSSLVFQRELAAKEYVYSAGLTGFGPTASDYDIRIENEKTGAGVRATANQPLDKLVFWACQTTACPEPYLRLRVPAGQTVAWTIRYTFYQKPLK
jgi:hypothetical protein